VRDIYSTELRVAAAQTAVIATDVTVMTSWWRH